MRSVCVALLLWLMAASAGAQTPGQSAADQWPGLLGEPQMIRKAVILADEWVGDGKSKSTDGFYPELRNMITGSGWISAGPGYRRRFFDGHALIDGSAAISWRAYRIAQARFELTDLAGHRLTVGSQFFWQDLTQIDYFGVGANSIEAARSEYQLKDTDVVGYTTVQANRKLAISGTFGRLQHPRLSAPDGPFLRGLPDALLTFPNDPGVAAQPNFLHGMVSVTADTRDHAGYSRAGGLYRVGIAAYSDRDYGQYSFRRYEAEGVQYVPLNADSWTLAVHGWGVLSDTSTSNTIPFYMLPSLGGHDTLRGFYDYRFHDRNLLLASAESRWALLRDIDVAAFFDAGNVADTVSRLNLHKRSWGGGLRVHSRTSTLARFDAGHSVEGWRFVFRLSDPFRVSRFSRRTAETPFVP